MSVRERLAENLEKIMGLRNINAQKVHDLAKEKGYKMHKTTVGNILNNESQVSSGKIDTLSITLDMPASHLIWEHGLDEKGKPVGLGSAPAKSDIVHVYKKIDLLLSELDIDDIEFKANTFSELLMTASSYGTDKADIKLLQILKDYSAA